MIESAYFQGAADVLEMLARLSDDHNGLIAMAADVYEDALGRVSKLEADRPPRLIGGPNE